MNKLMQEIHTIFQVKPDASDFKQLVEQVRVEKNNFTWFYWKLCAYYLAALQQEEYGK